MIKSEYPLQLGCLGDECCVGVGDRVDEPVSKTAQFAYQIGLDVIQVRELEIQRVDGAFRPAHQRNNCHRPAARLPSQPELAVIREMSVYD